MERVEVLTLRNSYFEGVEGRNHLHRQSICEQRECEHRVTEASSEKR